VALGCPSYLVLRVGSEDTLKNKYTKKTHSRGCKVTKIAFVHMCISFCTNIHAVKARANMSGSSSFDIVVDKSKCTR